MRTAMDRLNCGMCGMGMWSIKALGAGPGDPVIARWCPECDKASRMVGSFPPADRPAGWFDEGKAS